MDFEKLIANHQDALVNYCRNSEGIKEHLVELAVEDANELKPFSPRVSRTMVSSDYEIKDENLSVEVNTRGGRAEVIVIAKATLTDPNTWAATHEPIARIHHNTFRDTYGQDFAATLSEHLDPVDYEEDQDLEA